MIKSIAGHTDLPEFEQLSVTGTSAPEVLVSCIIVRADLSVDDQVTYDEAMDLFTPDCFTEITNTIADLSIDRITSEVLVEGTENLDFDSLTEVDKDKLRALLAIFVANNELPQD